MVKSLNNAGLILWGGFMGCHKTVIYLLYIASNTTEAYALGKPCMCR